MKPPFRRWPHVAGGDACSLMMILSSGRLVSLVNTLGDTRRFADYHLSSFIVSLVEVNDRKNIATPACSAGYRIMKPFQL